MCIASCNYFQKTKFCLLCCIYICTNDFEKSMNLSLLSPLANCINWILYPALGDSQSRRRRTWNSKFQRRQCENSSLSRMHGNLRKIKKKNLWRAVITCILKGHVTKKKKESDTSRIFNISLKFKKKDNLLNILMLI